MYTQINFRIFLATILSFVAFTTYGQIEMVSQEPFQELLKEKNIAKESSGVFSLAKNEFQAQLAEVGLFNEGKQAWKPIELPLPDGSMIGVLIAEAPVAEMEIYNKYPMNKTYKVIGQGKTPIQGRLAWSPLGLTGLVFVDDKAIFIEPLDAFQVVYEMQESAIDNMHCGVEKVSKQNKFVQSPEANTNGGTSRNYRIAIASSGEYTVAPGNTIASVNAAIDANLAALNALYDKEFAITFTKVATNNSIIFFDAATDGLEPNNRTASANTVISAGIGVNNYDLGHVFYEIPNINGGWATSGIAGIAVVCNDNWKARGWTGAGGNYSIDNFLGTFGHEIGHQFGADHTFYGTANNCANRSPGHGFEPGSGSSIMSYEGSCNSNSGCVANHNIVPKVNTIYFHAHSIDQILTYISLNACATSTVSGNTPPVVTAPADHTIPYGTPFTLTGSATDGDNDPLVYVWEEYDTDNLNLSCPAGHPDDAATSTTAPLFRSFDPSSSGNIRTFPQMGNVVNNTHTMGEILPTVARTTHFRLTARDFNANGGGMDMDEVIVNIDGSGPFTVTSLNASTILQPNSTETVTWNVASSDTYCPTVNVLLSVDGGYTYPTVLSAAVANDGSQTVTIPNVTTSNGRIKVECNTSGVVFFDINNEDFVIGGGCNPMQATIGSGGSVTDPVGDATLNLTLCSGVLQNTFTGTLSTSDAQASGIAVENNGTNTCTSFGNTPYYQIKKLCGMQDGVITFTKSNSVSLMLMTLYDDVYNPINVCANWVGSNGNSANGTITVNFNMDKSLIGGASYDFMISGFNSNGVGNFNVSTSPNVLDEGAVPGVGFFYRYLLVNTSNNEIINITEVPDLSNGNNFPQGDYEVHGLTYMGGADLSGYQTVGGFTSLENDLNAGNLCGVLSSNNVAVTITGPLPIELLSFGGRKQNKNIKLNWQTASEVNNDFFTLEKSSDGFNFEPIAKVQSKGNTTITQYYQFEDRNPFKGDNYYRLAQTDFDGTGKQAGNVILITYLEDDSYSIFPNPVEDVLTVRSNATDSHSIEYQILSIDGKIILSGTELVEKDVFNFQIPVEQLPRGHYILRISSKIGMKNISFLKS